MQHTLIIKKYKTKVFKEIINTFQNNVFYTKQIVYITFYRPKNNTI